MIHLQNVSHRYKQSSSLIFEDWTLQAQEHWLLLGASGSGKTTLLHIITGILKPDMGEVTINGTALYRLSSGQLDQFRGRNIGIVFQRPHLIRSLNVLDNLVLAQSLAGLRVDTRRVRQVLGSLNIGEKESAYPAELSQGQIQRVSIARAVINRPTLLIADEPTSSLDDQNARVVLELLKEQCEINNAVLLVATHDKRVTDSFKHSRQLK
ncbi:putative ABC transport system ATP-binding protein [Pedobacter sp. CAN_A7]|uniref:ABC transporter ATP-binding protein n=1 Tax=Pedobacter sp. CAN_A7 TaxID=2787722 RepID=UPI0018CB9C3D